MVSEQKERAALSLRCGTPPRLGSLPDTENEEALCYCCDLNTMITEHFYKKPIKSEVLTYKRAPF